MRTLKALPSNPTCVVSLQSASAEPDPTKFHLMSGKRV